MRGDDDGLPAVSVLDDVQQDRMFLGIKRHEEEVLQNKQRTLFYFPEFRLNYLSYRFVVWRDGVRIMVGSREYSSGVYLQSGRKMAEGLLKDELSPFFSGNVLYIREFSG